MAAQGKKKKIKGTKMALTDFLADGSSNQAPPARTDWAAEMESNDMEDLDMDFLKPKIDRSKLPTAPKSARGPDVDMDKVPSVPPFTAFIGNLAYETTEDNIADFFKKLNVLNVRLPEDRGRLRGFGYVEFADRQNLLDALNMNEENMMGRKVRVDLADQHQQNENKKSGGYDRQTSGDPDRAEGNWRAPPKSFDDFDRGPQRGGFDDRGPQRGGYDDRGPSRGFDDRGPSRGFDDRGSSRGFDDRGPSRGFDDRGPSRGFDDRGPSRGFDDRGPSRGGGYGRDRFDDRGPPRDRYDDRRQGYNDRGGRDFNRFDDRGPPRGGYDDRGPPGADDGGRRPFGSGYNRDDRHGSRAERQSPTRETPAERPRLNLKPRTKAPEDAPTTDKPPARKPSANIFGDAKPVDIVAKEKEKERAAPMSDKPPTRKPSANIFGDAKPVDTAAKEREIEERLRRGREDESRRKADEEKENTNTSPGYRPRQYSGEEGGGRQRRLSSNSSGKGRPGPPPVTSPGKPRRDSDVSNHSQEVFSGGEETKEEPRSPVSPAHRDEAASKLVPAPPPPVNIWEKRKETVVKTAVVSVKSPMESHTHIKSETRSIADAPSSSSSSSSTSQSPENKAAPPPKDNPWTRRQYNKESDEPVSSSPMGKPSGRGERSGSRGRGRGHGGYPDKGRGQESKPRHEKKIPQSIDEMPKYEPQVQKDFRQKNKFAGLLDDEDEDNGEDST
ncbi:eukaryotic translation initiation factor 4B-like isoform X2 [Mytilus edulis]|uniref:eukaryotic translation initiation factor 4B-like isoform X2 n=1 Tax=Mytilus edulis TaxID=6550 RepID=UPI0039F0495D